ncbi:unnamed protein product, partial [Schistosoma curassoni]|uniref:MDM2 n=1 Tax=Schistosoma curassoni TaxID=6186 RepID=A0A183JRC9_9TREM
NGDRHEKNEQELDGTRKEGPGQNIKPRPNPDDFCMTMWSYQEIKHEDVPLPELLEILLSGKSDLISKRVFGEIQPHRNLAQELRVS